MKRPKRGVSRPTPHIFLEFICDFRLLESHYDVGLQDVSYLLGGGGHCGYLVAQQRDCDPDLALGVANMVAETIAMMAIFAARSFCI
ncbi:MAG: hypothetical protein J6U69_06745, partial [Alistipes sp.]|nr:hypothetical protein [Alistipes sp.]